MAVGDGAFAAPLLVTSPTIRSGTTLVQRLLCSAPGGLVYGEEVGKDVEFQLQVLAARRLVYRHNGARFRQALSQVLDGETNDWIIDLMPGLEAYVDALGQGALAGMKACAAHAASVGRPAWGFKYPGMAPTVLPLLAEAMPGLRVVYVLRGLADTLRSAKAWGALPDAIQVQRFCDDWLAHQHFVHGWRAGIPLLVLRHEALVADPAAAIARLRAFAPIGEPDPGVVSRRINAPAGEAYREPEPLSPQEQEWVDAAVAAAPAWDGID
ncbi:MAG: hypothetical protein A2X76_00605 [Lysobacterales bacterium GWF1_69_6]|nr:MAG: hypothetical protein A2X76_00605 [Xanthomonadales bacterium GWF1_69_6]